MLGVIAMFSALLILLILPFVDFSRSRGLQFRPISKLMFWIFVANFFALDILGGKHVEDPFILFGQMSTALYFGYFIILVPFVSIMENTFIDLILHTYNNFIGHHINKSSRKIS